jgi:pyruvate carboxylase
MHKKISRLLVANRGEIAIRILRACDEMKIKTIAIYTHEDRYSLHRYKADESYRIGPEDEPLKPYLDIDEIIKLAKAKNVDAIHPGYGFLSENANFARACEANGIIWVGPSAEAMDALGNKITAKELALKAEIPMIEGNKRPVVDSQIALEEAIQIGFPVIVKAGAGGGGRGMRVVRNENDLIANYNEASREALNAFGDGTVFIEKYVENPKHIEVQICADNFGNMVHLFERDCSVQRRFQKVVEVAPAWNLKQETKEKLYEYAIRICKQANYNNVGTVEFLVDKEENIFFIEVNTRIQVEHTVTEMITGVDLVKAQIRIAMGNKLGSEELDISQDKLSINGSAIQCRITTEDPANKFMPDYGTVIAFRSAEGFGIRLDAGSVYPGVTVSPYFDSMLVKVTAHSRTPDGAARKMTRALREFRIRGVKTNIPFLINIVNHPDFASGSIDVNFIEKHPELFDFKRTLDRGTKTIQFLGDIIVNGNSDVKVKHDQRKFIKPVVPVYDKYGPYPDGSKQKLEALGADKFSQTIRDEKQILFTDTTLRDAHQSLLATRVRTYDMLKVAESFAKHHPDTFSMEVWGGATFDVALRFLKEDPWSRLQKLRAAVPNILLQMLFRGSNGVGYAAYPGNVLESFIVKSWETGIDVFRIFDSLNQMKALERSIKTVREKTNAIAQGTVCYTGDILDPKRTKYNLDYYLRLAKQIEDSGAHMLALKDMAGLLKPYAASELVTALRSTVSIPIHLHTHDTASIQAATYLKAVEAGVDVIDVALGGLSGLTSQPNFNSVAEMLRFSERGREMDMDSLNAFSDYWENVREYYYPFESGLKAGTAEVYKHEIPGGQYSNLKPQAIALGLGDQFNKIKKTFAEVNFLFGDIVKVTPSSKVVGDMAQFLVSNNIAVEDVLTKGDTLSFPESVKQLFRGELGFPDEGLPAELQKIILKDEKPFDANSDSLPDIDLEEDIAQFKTTFGKDVNETDYLSYKMFPKVFEEYKEHRDTYGDVSTIPTLNFLFGLKPGEETEVETAPGKTLLIRFLSAGPADETGKRMVFFKLNGQTMNIIVVDESLKKEAPKNTKADKNDTTHIGAPLQGMLSKILVKEGQEVKKNEPLFIIEAMKMETIVTSMSDSVVSKIVLADKTPVTADDLILILQP